MPISTNSDKTPAASNALTPHGTEVTLSELIALQTAAIHNQPQPEKRTATSLGGNSQSRLRGRGIEFSEVRHYQAGDDIRSMDWRVTARCGEPHIKLYHEERERPVFFVVDFSPSMFFATRTAYKSVVAAYVAALLGWQAIQRGDRIGAVMFNQTHCQLQTAHSRKQGILNLLKQLTDFTNTPNSAKKPEPPTLQTALEQLQPYVKSGSIVYLISDFYHLPDKLSHSLYRLSRHCPVTAIKIFDPIEATPPPPGRYGISDGIDFSHLNMHSTQARHRYQCFCLERDNALQQLLKRHQIPLWRCATNDNLIATLTHYLRR